MNKWKKPEKKFPDKMHGITGFFSVPDYSLGYIYTISGYNGRDWKNIWNVGGGRRRDTDAKYFGKNN